MWGRLIFFAKFGRYWLVYTMDWYTIYPCTIEPSGCALCITKWFNDFKFLSTIHIDLVCTGPHNPISSTWCMKKCSSALKNPGGIYLWISHTRWWIFLFQYLISSLWISLDESHLQMMQENNNDQWDWGIYNKVVICKTQYINNLCNKMNTHFHHINCYLPHVFTNIIYNLFCVVVKAMWEI